MNFFKITGLALISVVVYSCTSPEPEKETIVPFPDEPVVSVSGKVVKGYQRNWKTEGVKGKVKTIFCRYYKQFVPNSWLTNYVTKEHLTFDRNGNVLEQTRYLEDQVFSFRCKYGYDKLGNCLKTISLAEKSDSILFLDIKRLNKQGLFESSKYMTRIPVKTGSSKYKIRTQGFRNEYELISDSQVIYEDYEILGKKAVKSGFRNVENYESGNMMGSTTYSEGKLLSKAIMRYDSRGNMLFRSDSSSFGIQVWKLEYDSNNHQTYFSARDDQSGVFNETHRTFDKHGNQIKQVSYRKGILYERDSYTDTYTYDAQNNWTKRVRKKLNGELISVLKRKITYY